MQKSAVCPSVFVHQALRRMMHSIGAVALTLVAVFGPQRSFADVDPLLHFIAAQQEATAEIYDRLSYSAVLKTKTLESFSDELLDQTFVFTIERRGASALYTCEHSLTIQEFEQRENGRLLEPLVRVRQEPIVQRLLHTEAFLASWPDVATPSVTLYRAEDWDGAVDDRRKAILTMTDGAGLREYCFGDTTPFYVHAQRTESTARWEIIQEPDELYRLNRTVWPGTPHERRDLTLWIHGESGLMRESRFTPNETSTQGENEFRTLAIGNRTLRVPVAHTRSHSKEGETRVSSFIEFDDYADRFDLPPLVLSDLGLPENAVVVVALPSGATEKHLWKGGQLVRLAQI